MTYRSPLETLVTLSLLMAGIGGLALIARIAQ